MYVDKIFERATIRGIADYLLFGLGPDEDDRSYEERLDEPYMRFEKAVEKYDKSKTSELLDLCNEVSSNVECPLIVDATVTKGSYMEIVVPTIAEISPAVSQDQNGIVVTVDKVEYAENETRVYVTINNGTDYNFSCGTYSAKLLIDGKQIDQDNMSQTLYNSPELTELSYEVMAGTSSSGTLIFPAIEQGVAFQFILPDAYSDNYDLMFTNYMIDVPVQ